MAKLTELARDIDMLAARLEDFRLAQESLEFCLEVHRRYTTGGTEPNPDMDKDKALAQLLDSVDRMLKV